MAVDDGIKQLGKVCSLITLIIRIKALRVREHTLLFMVDGHVVVTRG